MIPISDKLKTYMRDGNGRYFEVKFVVNGVDFPCDIRRLKIKKGSCGSILQPQTYFSTIVEAELNSTATLKHGAKLEVWLSASQSGDNSFYKVATAYVRHPSRKVNEISFTAEGTIASKLGLEYTAGVGSTIQAMIDNIERSTNINIIVENGLSTSLAPNQAADLKGYLMREVLEDIAGLFFGYMTEDVDGNVVIKTFNTEAEAIELKDERMATLPIIHETATVTGVQIKTTTSDGQTDYVYPEGVATVNCSLSNALMTEAIFNEYADKFVGLTYTPYSVDVGLGDFSIEPFDCVLINGSKTIITEIIHNIDGGISTELSATTLNDGEEYSRTEKKMQSDISYSRIQSGNIGGSEPTVPDVTPSANVKYVDLAVSQANRYRDYLEIRNGCFVIAFLTINYKMIPAEYKPAYPVTVYPATQISCASITLLPETYTDSNGKEYVAYVESPNSYISPKDPYEKYLGTMQYRNWGNYSADDKANALINIKPCFWILADKLDELLEVGENYQ